MSEDHISKETFLLELFGTGGRELANPSQVFTDNPNDVFLFIEENTKAHRPSFISVNPRSAHEKVSGIEKLFFDFDYADKTYVKKLEQRIKDPLKREKKYEKRKMMMRNEVCGFLRKLEAFRITPMVVKTRKGFHVYIYFDKIYTVTDNDGKLLKETYNQLQQQFVRGKKGDYKFLDNSVIGDVKRMCRIPTSIHEVSGEECILVKAIDGDKVISDKLRSIEYYRQRGLKSNAWVYAVAKARDKIDSDNTLHQEKQEDHRENWELQHGFVGFLRFCFLETLKGKEMCHKQRLALLLEGWYSGLKTEEQLIDLFRPLNDFDFETTRTQVKWFLDHKVYLQSHPYTCKKMEEENWCLKDRCSLWQKRNKETK